MLENIWQTNVSGKKPKFNNPYCTENVLPYENIQGYSKIVKDVRFVNLEKA